MFISSCGDDGRIRGWKWKEILERKASEQGNVSFRSNQIFSVTLPGIFDQGV